MELFQMPTKHTFGTNLDQTVFATVMQKEPGNGTLLQSSVCQDAERTVYRARGRHPQNT